MLVDGWILAVDAGVTPAAAAVGDGDHVAAVDFGVPDDAGYAAILAAAAGEAAQKRETAIPARLVIPRPGGPAEDELRAAAATAGLPAPEFVSRPVAIAGWLARSTKVGRHVAILDVRGDGLTTTVLRRTRTGFEIAGQPGGLTVLTDGNLRPGVYELLATITGAGLTPDQLDAIHVVGDAGHAAEVAALVPAVLGVEPGLATSPQTAALGTVRAAKQQASASPDGTGGRGLSRRVVLLSGAGCAAAVGLGLYLTEGSRGTSPQTSTRTGTDTGTSAAVKLPVILDGLPGQANAVAFTPDGTTLAACSDSAAVLLWNLTGPRAVVTHTVELPSNQITSMAVSPDGKTIAIAAGPVYFVDMASGRVSTSVLAAGQGIASVAYSPDGAAIAAGCYDTTVRVWDTATKKPHKVLSGLGDNVIGVAFSPDGKMLAGCCQEEAQLWNVATWKATATLMHTVTTDNFVVFSPDGQLLVSGGGDLGDGAQNCQLDVFNVTTGKRNSIIGGDATDIAAALFTPDGKTLIGGSGGDGVIRQWDVTTGRLIASLRPPASLTSPPMTPSVAINALPYATSSLALSPDGGIIAAGGNGAPGNDGGTVWLVGTAASGFR